MRMFKLFGLGAALVLLVLAAASNNVVTSGAGIQPMPGKGTVYVTKFVPAPGGAILKVLDFGLGLFTPIVSGLGSPPTVLCGSDGRLYITESVQERNRWLRRILRFNQDGSGRTVVGQWPSTELNVGGLVFASNGDLYFGTSSTQEAGPTQGIWRIPGALQADQQFNSPQRVVSPENLPVLENWTSARPYAFLIAGPFQGDLLITVSPNWSGTPGGQVLRAPQPDFNTAVEFVPAFDDTETGQPFLPPGLAVNSQGDVFVTDFTNGKVLRYGSDGTLKGVLAKIEWANQVAVGPDDLVYVTNYVGGAGYSRGGVFVFARDGKPVTSGNFPLNLRGVTVCAPQ
jgi:hypothetical protein